MKKLITVIVLFLISSNVFSFSEASLISDSSLSKVENPINSYSLKKLSSYSIKELESIAGRKLKFKEKIAFKILKIKLKLNPKAFENTGNKDGKTSEVFGIIAICSLFLFPFITLPFAILAIVYGKKAQKKTPNDKHANTGIILGWISLGLILLLALLLIAIIASLTGY